MCFDNFFWRRKFFFGVEKSKVANRLKRVFPKFEADRSEVRGVNGRSKFDVRGVNASSKYISRKYPPPAPEIFKRCARSAGPYLVASNPKPSITSVDSQILPLAKCYHEAKIDLRVVLSFQTGPKSSPKVLGSTPKGST